MRAVNPPHQSWADGTAKIVNVAIATFIEKDISKGCPFLLYKAQKAQKGGKA